MTGWNGSIFFSMMSEVRMLLQALTEMETTSGWGSWRPERRSALSWGASKRWVMWLEREKRSRMAHKRSLQLSLEEHCMIELH